MVVINDAAVGAYRYVNAGFLVVFISGLAYFDEGGCLAAADTLCFTGNADGAAADAYFDEVSACFGQEEEAVTVDYVACTYSDLAVVFSWIQFRVIFCHSEKPSEESMQRTSAPASTSFGTLSS